VQDDPEFVLFRQWLTESRRDAGTKLVTTGHILNPPFETACERKQDRLLVTIRAQNDAIQLSCSRIVLSRFRPNQVGFFMLNPEGAVQQRRFVATLTNSYQRILASFPPGSKFKSSELYTKVTRIDGGTQAHARRRWKELKYDYGFDVDSTPDRQTYWRGDSSVPIRDPFPRPDDNKLRAVMLPLMPRNSDGEYECNNCGVLVQFAIANGGDDEVPDPFAPRKSRGLLDHRRPILQGGDDALENLQVFCETCNNFKATTCNKCPYAFQCEGCIWAHPEKVRQNRVILTLDETTANTLRSVTGLDLRAGAEKILRAVANGKLKI
jgi:5-methylcytosine-specific restriction endonuclease McrA